MQMAKAKSNILVTQHPFNVKAYRVNGEVFIVVSGIPPETFEGLPKKWKQALEQIAMDSLR
jgi:hypothetical protein